MKQLDREVVREKAEQRLKLLPRERRALEAAASSIDDDFDLQKVVEAFNAFDDSHLNRARALERNFEIIHNYLIEIIRFALMLEGKVEPSQESGAKRDFRSAARLGVINNEQVDVLDRLHDIRSGMQH